MKIKSLTLRNPLPDGEFHFDSSEVELDRLDDGFTIEKQGTLHWQHGSNVADIVIEPDEPAEPAEPTFECDMCGEKKATAAALASHKRNKHKAK